MWASIPASASRSANQPQPYVASNTTENGSGSSSPNTRRKASGLWSRRRSRTTVPPSSRATTWLSLRCRSTPRHTMSWASF